MKPLFLESNTNYTGPSPQAVTAFKKVASELCFYPEPWAEGLTADLARLHGLDSSRVLVGNGASELIDLALRDLAGTGRSVVLPAVTFILYGELLERYRIPFRLAPWPGADPDPLEVCRLATADTALVILCNPNNPTGTYVSPDVVRACLDALPSGAGLLLDEAYAEYATGSARTDFGPELRAEAPLLTVRTFSKAYGLAGLRAGYALGPAAWLERLRPAHLRFGFSAPALAAGRAALADPAHLARVVTEAEAVRSLLANELTLVGCRPQPSRAPFLLVPAPDGASRVERLWAEHGIKAASGFEVGGPPNWVRLSLPPKEQAQRVLAAWTACLSPHRSAGSCKTAAGGNANVIL